MCGGDFLDSDSKQSHLEVALELDIDLIKMIHYDQFLADNFIRCFFRYYAKMPRYIKDVFVESYREMDSIQQKE